MTYFKCNVLYKFTYLLTYLLTYLQAGRRSHTSAERTSLIKIQGIGRHPHQTSLSGAYAVRTCKTRCRHNGTQPYWPAVQCRPLDRHALGGRPAHLPAALQTTDNDGRQKTTTFSAELFSYVFHIRNTGHFLVLESRSEILDLFSWICSRSFHTRCYIFIITPYGSTA